MNILFARGQKSKAFLCALKMSRTAGSLTDGFDRLDGDRWAKRKSPDNGNM